MDPKEEFAKNIHTNMTILSRAELWASGMGGTKDEANQLMSEGFKLIRQRYEEKPEYETIDGVLDKEIKELEERNKESVLAGLIKENRHFLHEEK